MWPFHRHKWIQGKKVWTMEARHYYAGIQMGEPRLIPVYEFTCKCGEVRERYYENGWKDA